MARFRRTRAPVRRRRPARAPMRQVRRTYRRSRPRNSVNQLTMRAPLAARLLRVRLPWVKTLSASASQSYAFQGNGIVPYTVAGQSGYNFPAAGDSLPAGEVEYSSLYDKYFINGSSIQVEAINSQNTGGSSAVVRAVLLAVPFSVDNTDNWPAVKTQLDGYTYDQLLAWPFAKWRMLGANSGGASRTLFKMFRKTRSMCGIKDLRDNAEYGAQLTDGSAVTSSPDNQAINPRNGFMYYFRVFTAGTPTTEITVRMTLYCTLTHREFNPIMTITAPEEAPEE